MQLNFQMTKKLIRWEKSEELYLRPFMQNIKKNCVVRQCLMQKSNADCNFQNTLLCGNHILSEYQTKKDKVSFKPLYTELEIHHLFNPNHFLSPHLVIHK